MRIISLSTIPSRFSAIGPTLKSLLDQKGIDEIRLYVPRKYRRFPAYDGSPPAVPAGITVVRVEEDLGPATKVLYAARELRGTQAQILFCDDDRLYQLDWADRLFAEQDRRPDECVALWGKPLPPEYGRLPAHRPVVCLSSTPTTFGCKLCHFRQRLIARLLGQKAKRSKGVPVRRAGYADLVLGFCGVVIRPHFFDDEAISIPPILWAVDDVWLSGILAKNGIPIWVPSGFVIPAEASSDKIDPLKTSNIDGTRRHDANRLCIDYMREKFNVWQ